MNKKVSGIVTIVFAILYLMYTPFQSKFATHIGELDLRFGLLDICISLTNKLHIIGFGILTVLLLSYLRDTKSKYLKTFLVVIGFGLIIEITQIFFIEGHFRMRDLLSDAVGAVVSFGLYKLILEKSNNLTPIISFFRVILVFVLQIILTMLIYYSFKEISIIIGGENLRKYL